MKAFKNPIACLLVFGVGLAIALAARQAFAQEPGAQLAADNSLFLPLVSKADDGTVIIPTVLPTATRTPTRVSTSTVTPTQTSLPTATNTPPHLFRPTHPQPRPLQPPRRCSATPLVALVGWPLARMM